MVIGVAIRRSTSTFYEVRALLPVDDAGEGAVLALDEYARVQHHRQQEPSLSLAEPKDLDGLCALGGEHREVPMVRRLQRIHRNISAAPR